MILLITLVFRFQGAGFLFGTGTDDGFIAHLTRRYLLTIALSVVAILLSLARQFWTAALHWPYPHVPASFLRAGF